MGFANANINMVKWTYHLQRNCSWRVRTISGEFKGSTLQSETLCCGSPSPRSKVKKKMSKVSYFSPLSLVCLTVLLQFCFIITNHIFSVAATATPSGLPSFRNGLVQEQSRAFSRHNSLDSKLSTQRETPENVVFYTVFKICSYSARLVLDTNCIL